MLVRFVAAALIGLAVVNLGLYWVVCSHKNVPMETFPCVAKSLPFLAGIVMLIKAKALAEWLSDKLDL